MGALTVREFLWSIHSPGAEWRMLLEEDCVTYTRRLWEKCPGPMAPLTVSTRPRPAATLEGDPRMSDPRLNLVKLVLCDPCLDGKGGECHSPGCCLFLNRAPDLSLRGDPRVHIQPLDELEGP
jgi:hypothetical protein